MTRKVLINQTVKNIKDLPDRKLQEVSDYVEFLLHNMDNSELNEEIARAASTSKSFQFLEDEEDLYSEKDLKEVYK